MKMLFSAILMAIFWVSALAQSPATEDQSAADVFIGYSYLRSDMAATPFPFFAIIQDKNLHGWNAAASIRVNS